MEKNVGIVFEFLNMRACWDKFKQSRMKEKKGN